MLSKKYKDKYIDIDNIYDILKEDIKLDRKQYKAVLRAYLDLFTEELLIKKNVVHLPNKMGFCYIKKQEHKRPFHIRVDWKESKLKGELVKYKVPILDDYYYKLMWHRGKDMGKCKMMPLSKIKTTLKKVLETEDY